MLLKERYDAASTTEERTRIHQEMEALEMQQEGRENAILQEFGELLRCARTINPTLN